jgi:hypothetical protein
MPAAANPQPTRTINVLIDKVGLVITIAPSVAMPNPRTTRANIGSRRGVPADESLIRKSSLHAQQPSNAFRAPRLERADTPGSLLQRHTLA